MFHTIEEVLEDLRRGKVVIVMDDEGRENEGDLLCAAEKVTSETINFMARYARGLICVPMESDRLDALGLHPMRVDMGNKHLKDDTAWTISVDASKDKGVTTGISALDRSQTVSVLIDEHAGPSNFITPGHIFPLRAKKGGVLVRAGHTEASVDLTRLAGLFPAGVICEIMNDDGTMARNPDLNKFSKKHGIKICTIDSLIEYRRQSEKLVKRTEESEIMTDMGMFKLYVYQSNIDGLEHLALVKGIIDSEKEILVRVHSESKIEDTFRILNSEGAGYLHMAMKSIEKNGSGVLVYMSKSIEDEPLTESVKMFNMLQKKENEGNQEESVIVASDLRHYGVGAQILVDLGVKKLNLLTNSPRKVVGLDGYGLSISKRIAIKPS